ncbi:MAG: DEAD/DEAH box helicase [Bacteroidia bacterium]|nr:DEAD/DEAH box helicase [Bacteroidia bacterium]
MSVESIQSAWAQFNFNKQILTALEEAGFLTPTEVQRKCIPLIMGGQEVIGVAQTGTGKTAAYVLPVLMKIRYAQGNEPRALVLVPTKELAIQIAEHSKALAKYTDLRITAIYGGVGPKTQIEIIETGIDLVIATPGRLLELYLKKELVLKQIKTLVLDEADRMMEMGFMRQLKQILEVIPGKRQNLLFTATFPEKVENLSKDFLEFPIKVEVTPQAMAASQVEQLAYHVPNLRTKINFIEHLLGDKEEYSRVLIFTRSKETADNVFKFIDRKNLGPVRVIHSNKGQNTRINAMNEFKEGKLRVLVSTDVSSRGIDVTGVSQVINFDVPIVYDDYIHRIGRTGRALAIGKAITLVNESELFHLKKIEKLIREKIKVKKLPTEVLVAETQKDEAKIMAREIDRQKRLADPEYQGAFHNRKRK